METSHHGSALTITEKCSKSRDMSDHFGSDQNHAPSLTRRALLDESYSTSLTRRVLLGEAHFNDAVGIAHFATAVAALFDRVDVLHA